MYDIDEALKTPEQCRIVMERALAHGKQDLYTAAFRQLCKISGAAHDDPSDPLIRAAFEAVAAYEQTLKEKHGKKVLHRERARNLEGKACISPSSTGQSSTATVQVFTP